MKNENNEIYDIFMSEANLLIFLINKWLTLYIKYQPFVFR